MALEIYLENISKRYGRNWVFKDLSYHFQSAKRYSITGRNGSGKSTLLSILCGKTPYSKGKIRYTDQGLALSVDEVYKRFSISTTSMLVIEEFTLEEIVNFHFKFRDLVGGLNTKDFLNALEMTGQKHKVISNFSSGMKQRLKLGLAICTQSNVLLLDEPGANLDRPSKDWFQSLLQKYLGSRTIIIASNDPEDYQICTESVNITKYKD